MHIDIIAATSEIAMSKLILKDRNFLMPFVVTELASSNLYAVLFPQTPLSVFPWWYMIVSKGGKKPRPRCDAVPYNNIPSAQRKKNEGE